MELHAGPEPLPELAEFLSAFQLRFRRSEGPKALERYLTGLLSELPNKNCDTMAQALPATSQQRLQELMTRMQWDEEDLNRQRVEKMTREATVGDGVLVFDDTGFPKQGKASAGVTRQYSGTLGKVGNCQVAVTCLYSDPLASWPVSARLYLPESWTTDAERRRKAGIPEDLVFQTKPEIALALLDQANAWGARHVCIVADADYGDNPNFLDGLGERREHYVVGVRRDFRVQLQRPEGQAPPRRAEEVLAELPLRAWRTIRWREGSKGWLRKKFVALRCYRATGEGTLQQGWLVGERAARGQSEPQQKYYWSNFEASVPLERLVGYAHRRYATEQFNEEAKQELGWDQYQGRLWVGFHRHAVTVMLAYSFLVWQELGQRRAKPRRGRPRGAFSPSGGSAARVLAGDPSRGGTVAAP